MKNLIFIFLILSVNQIVKAELLSVQTQLDNPKKVFFYYPNFNEANNSSFMFFDSKCAKSPMSVSKDEIKPVSYVKLLQGGEPKFLPIDIVLSPSFVPAPGYPEALQVGNKLVSITKFFSLEEHIFKVDVTDCISNSIVDYLFQYNTRGNCFNAAVRFHLPQEQMQSMDHEYFSEFLTTKCREISEPKFGAVGVFLREGKPEHAFIYIKDDWVFTKNGEKSTSPYQFQRFYLTEKIYAPWITEKMRFYDCKSF